jgi:hypothetical protein
MVRNKIPCREIIFAGIRQIKTRNQMAAGFE